MSNETSATLQIRLSTEMGGVSRGFGHGSADGYAQERQRRGCNEIRTSRTHRQATGGKGSPVVLGWPPVNLSTRYVRQSMKSDLSFIIAARVGE